MFAKSSTSEARRGRAHRIEVSGSLAVFAAALWVLHDQQRTDDLPGLPLVMGADGGGDR